MGEGVAWGARVRKSCLSAVIFAYIQRGAKGGFHIYNETDHGKWFLAEQQIMYLVLRQQWIMVTFLLPQ